MMKALRALLPLLVALLSAACATTPDDAPQVLGAISAEVVDSRFGVVVESPKGNTLVLTRIVPLMPGTILSWALLLAEAPDDIEFREVYTLPAPPREVTGGARQSDTTVVEREAQGTNEDGWLVGSWVLGEGDPPGRHVIDVFVDDTLIYTFEFDVLVPRAPQGDAGTTP
jgi:hypothetical protein